MKQTDKPQNNNTQPVLENRAVTAQRRMRWFMIIVAFLVISSLLLSTIAKF